MGLPCDGLGCLSDGCVKGRICSQHTPGCLVLQPFCPYKQHTTQRHSPSSSCTGGFRSHSCQHTFQVFTVCIDIHLYPFVCIQVCHECSSLLREAESASHDCTLQQQQLAALRRAVNPYAAESSRLSQIQAENQKALKDMGVQKTELQQKVSPHANCTSFSIEHSLEHHSCLVPRRPHTMHCRLYVSGLQVSQWVLGALDQVL